ncbi:hypothetical protein FNU76_20310 [Chitinimonas arctica]|uniref:Uncharacterized protein n=1 Tax=Chitinimonas arctica TaxID=2594795 RepID=A0A516SK57_9NEIS|nr:hypothetical protein [Chitinimonas arctica]QDQ28513.1 hypothetical protein FNU76_20310 [Chitinimonas arctica]
MRRYANARSVANLSTFSFTGRRGYRASVDNNGAVSLLESTSAEAQQLGLPLSAVNKHIVTSHEPLSPVQQHSASLQASLLRNPVKTNTVGFVDMTNPSTAQPQGNGLSLPVESVFDVSGGKVNPRQGNSMKFTSNGKHFTNIGK